MQKKKLPTRSRASHFIQPNAPCIFFHARHRDLPACAFLFIRQRVCRGVGGCGGHIYSVKCMSCVSSGLCTPIHRRTANQPTGVSRYNNRQQLKRQRGAQFSSQTAWAKEREALLSLMFCSAVRKRICVYTFLCFFFCQTVFIYSSVGLCFGFSLFVFLYTSYI
jgi:hypothetical protein